MFDDHTCMAFLLSFFLSFAEQMSICVYFFFIRSYFVVQMLNYGI